jgi:beta-lactamase regulating signal transducer with metallopeptidase domain
MHPVSSLNPQAVAIWFDALLKSFVVLGFGGGVCLVWRRAAAATRHLIWFLALAGLPLLPLLPRVLPAARRPLWSVSSEMVSGNQISLSLELVPTMSSGNSVPIQVQSSGNLPVVKTATRVFHAQLHPNGLAIAYVTWAGGIALMLLYAAVGRFQLGRISHQARPLDTPDWSRVLADTCEALSLRRRVVLLQSNQDIMPLTWGWLRPAVLLPPESNQWPVDRRRVVLLHELAHVKRLDCLTQTIARIITALYWFNPLAWVAVRQMCIEREHACDDLVLNGGCKASDYAGHLLQIAKAFRRVPQAAGIAMARSSNLEQRVTAIVDASRSRRLRPIGVAGVLLATVTVLFCIGGYKTTLANDSVSSLRQQQLTRLQEFSKQKLQQAQILMAASGDTMLPDYQRLFDAATTGDIQTVTNLYRSFSMRHPQYNRVKGVRGDSRLRTSYWQAILEMDLAYDHLANCDPKYTEIAVDGIVNSVPPGSIYFGGTDPGRGLPTAFSKSSIDADPFYTLTQNALADGSYLEYLRKTYGDQRQTLDQLAAARPRDPQAIALDKDYQAALDKQYDLNEKPENDPEREAADTNVNVLEQKVNARTDELVAQIKSGNIKPVADYVLGPAPEPIYIPTKEDSEHCFQEYTQDAEQRMEKHQLKDGEKVTHDANGKIQVSGQIAVMAINARLAKIIFDKSPDREFYIEESWPLDWMYPHLEPHGLIMKINREPQSALSEEVVQRDHDYWQNLTDGMIGNWLTEETPVQTVTEFAEKVYLQKDLSGFTGDAGFVRDNYAPKMFSKWRSSIAGVYAWRVNNQSVAGAAPAQAPVDRERMIKEADFAFKQAFALCPYSPEAVFRYTEFLVNQKRQPDALLIAEAASRLDPSDNQFKDLVGAIRRSK